MMAGNEQLGDRLLGMLGNFRITIPHPPRFWAVRLPQEVSPRRLALLLLLGGTASVGIMGVLNAAAQAKSSDGVPLKLPLIFIVLILVYRFAQRALIDTASAAIEDSLQATQARITGKMVRLELDAFESLPSESLLPSLGQHYVSISDAVLPVTLGVQSSAILILAVGYLVCLSLLAGIMTAVLGVTLAYIYLREENELAATMRATSDERANLLFTLSEVTEGFKELRLNGEKRAAVMDDVVRHSRRAATAMSATATIHGRLMVFATSVAYLLAASSVLILPMIDNVDQRHLFTILTLVLFVIGPLGGAVGSVQHFTRAGFAMRQIRDFEARLDQFLADVPPASPPPPFQRLELRGVTYRHGGPASDTSFCIGPLDFILQREEIVFVIGANGSGKTTLLRVLIGLYSQQSGEVVLNGSTISSADRESYRHNFSAVLSDFHLFHRPYGMTGDQLEALDRILEELSIRHKLPEDLTLGYDPSRLSTGQRKRLALAIATAEGRPVLVVDEWAADQDPQAREAFYRVVLPQLREAGFAIVAVTHDDRYFDTANRRYRMEEGRLSLVVE